jgi:hypothetical protein
MLSCSHSTVRQVAQAQSRHLKEETKTQVQKVHATPSNQPRKRILPKKKTNNQVSTMKMSVANSTYENLSRVHNRITVIVFSLHGALENVCK